MITYPAITLWQPWATLVAIEAKPLEFRSWPAPARIVGQRVAIHAGARPVRTTEIKELLLRLHSPHWQQTGLVRDKSIELLETWMTARAVFPLSAIVCTALLGEPIRDQALFARMGIDHVNDSDRDEHSNYGWPLSEIQPLLPPEPAAGRQGWWTWRTES